MSQVNMSHADYLAHKSYGASDLIKMSRSFAHWKWCKENPEKPGRPLVVGSATHLMLQSRVTMHPELIHEGVLIYRDGSSLTKGFKQFQADNPLKYCLDETETALCTKLTDALMNNEEVMSYIKDAVPESTIMANYPLTSVGCKVRPDWLHMKRGLSINIKTTNDATEGAFMYAAKDYGYEFQSAMYCSILSEEFGRSFDEIHILVEKTEDNEPPPIEIYSFGDDTIAFAKSQIALIMERIPECEKTGLWPMNKSYLNQIDLPLHFRRMAP
jgi:PDDEXK-like uncharacterized protein DUF3799